MTPPASVQLARDLAPDLRGLHWGIGGSSLLWKLGLAREPRDLDIVTTVAHFPELRRRIGLRVGEGTCVSHPTYTSQLFARFAPEGPVAIDLFAGVRVRRPEGIV